MKIAHFLLEWMLMMSTVFDRSFWLPYLMHFFCHYKFVRTVYFLCCMILIFLSTKVRWSHRRNSRWSHDGWWRENFLTCHFDNSENFTRKDRNEEFESFFMYFLHETSCSSNELENSQLFDCGHSKFYITLKSWE